MIAEVQAGHVTEAIMITHNYIDTNWFHKLVGVATAICFTKGRVKLRRRRYDDPERRRARAGHCEQSDGHAHHHR